MTGQEIIDAIKKKFDLKTDRDIAKNLGITTQAIQNWKKRKTVTARQIAGLINYARKESISDFQNHAIIPIVEFFPIEKCLSTHEKKYELFSSKDLKGKKHPYLFGLQEELKEHHGIYVFFDSRGQAIYVGKARKQKLWHELKSAFNRERGSVQRILRVRHPSRRQDYKTSEEMTRQIKDAEIPLYELAYYFSAYKIIDGMIEDVESLLVRSFANDLLNKRMEKFKK